LARCEAALANAAAGATWAALPKFLVEIFREYTGAQIKPLIGRVEKLEAKR
jgi:hypothetical protein